MKFIHCFIFFAATSFAGASRAELIKSTGTVSGVQTVDDDDLVDAELVIPSLRPSTILNFQFADLLSPNETLTAGPASVKVPGNLFFPEQSESYDFIPITISKPSFSIFTERGVSNELTAIWVELPFSKAVDLGRNHAPYTQLVPLVTVKGYGINYDRDWSTVPQISMQVTQTFNKAVNFKWNRTAGGEHDFDLVLSVQETPANRWMLTDLVGAPGSTGSLNISSTLASHYKVIFARITNNDQNKPQSAVAYFQSGAPSGTYSADGLPNAVGGAKLSQSTLTWNSINKPGWVAVLRNAPTQVANLVRSPFDVLALGLAQVRDSKLRLDGWVKPSAGRYTLSSSPAQNENIVLLYVGTDRDVPAPAESDVEPALFTYASELSMIKLQ